MADYVGYRTQKRLSQQKKKKTLRRTVEVVAVLLIVFFILAVAFHLSPFNKAWSGVLSGFKWVGHKISGVFQGKKKLSASAFLEEGKKTGNYLIVITRQADDGTTLVSSAVLASYDSRNSTGSLVLFPADLRLQVPGAGEDELANLVQLDDGRVGKTMVAISNLVGVNIDRYVMMSDHDARLFLRAMNTDFNADVTKKLDFDDGSLGVKLSLKPGRQKLSTDQLAAYLTYADDGGDVELVERQEQFVPEFLSASRKVSDNADAIMKKSGSLFDTSASDKQLAGLWQAYASLDPSKVSAVTLPVKEVKIEKSVLHMVDRSKLDAFKKKYVMSDYQVPNRIRVEILNGCGTPGIGEKVAADLDPMKFQVVNNGNADNFSHPDTVVILYDASKKTADGGEEIKRELEVGRLDKRPPNQNLVDISIIVGKDYASK